MHKVLTKLNSNNFQIPSSSSSAFSFTGWRHAKMLSSRTIFMMEYDGFDFYRARLSPSIRKVLLCRDSVCTCCTCTTCHDCAKSKIRAFSAVFSGSSWFAPEVETDSHGPELSKTCPWKSHREILPCGKTLQQPSKFGSPSYKSECGHQFFFNTTYGFTGPGLWRRCSSPSSRTTLQVMRKVTTQNIFSTPPGGTVACSACSAFATSPWAKIDPNQVKHSSSNGPKKIRPQACSSPVN